MTLIVLFSSGQLSTGEDSCFRNKISGIPLFTCEQAEFGWTEFNSQYEVSSSTGVSVYTSAVREQNNTLLKIDYEGLYSESDCFEINISTFGHLSDARELPSEISCIAQGIGFSIIPKGDTAINCSFEAYDIDGHQIKSRQLELKKNSFAYEIDLKCNNLKRIAFRFSNKNAILSDSGSVLIDNIYFMTSHQNPFTPPSDDQDFLDWLNQSSLRYFDWSYREPKPGRGVIHETSRTDSRVSISGLGYGLAVTILASQEGIISKYEAERRCLAILQWLYDLNCNNGIDGWHGFPFHYLSSSRTAQCRSEVSTIDWAICAAGIRVARQQYPNNHEINLVATTLLNRADWSKTVANDSKIAMGFNGTSGKMNDFRWGLAYSEETELVYLEALATSKIDPKLLDEVVRKRKKEFYPSWFGAGFTYNWLQLWTGPIAPYKNNSRIAYQYDLSTCQESFKLPLIGLTACLTVSNYSNNGFLKWQKYISNQGSNVHATNILGEVIRCSPAPYGAALALPFLQQESLEALRSYADLGYSHPFLGLPDSVRLKDIPEGFLPAPSWNHFDINIGSIALAIDQVRNNRVATNYKGDQEIDKALGLLVQSF